MYKEAKTHRASPRRPAVRNDRINRTRDRNHLSRRIRLIVSGGALLLGLILGGYFLYVWIPKVFSGSTNLSHRVQRQLGWTVQHLVIEGVKKIKPLDVAYAVGAKKGDLISNLELEGIYERLSQMPWVRNVLLQRRLPDTLYVRIVERTPQALFQEKGVYSLIDSEGVVIEPVALKNFPHFMVVTGQDAPAKSPKLIEQLQEFPDLKKRVSGAMFISQRRWDLILDHKIRIKLPEGSLKKALGSLNKLIQDGKFLSKEIKVLDLRHGDRIYFFQSDKALERSKAKIKAGPLKIT